MLHQIQDAIAVNAAVVLAVDNAKLAQDDFRTKSETPPTLTHTHTTSDFTHTHTHTYTSD